MWRELFDVIMIFVGACMIAAWGGDVMGARYSFLWVCRFKIFANCYSFDIKKKYLYAI